MTTTPCDCHCLLSIVKYRRKMFQCCLFFSSKKKPPPDLKIDLINATSASSVSTHSPYSNSTNPSKGGDNNSSFYLLGAPGSVSDMTRRHSHTVPTSGQQCFVHKSAPVTPLNRSTNNVNALDQSKYVFFKFITRLDSNSSENKKSEIKY